MSCEKLNFSVIQPEISQSSFDVEFDQTQKTFTVCFGEYSVRSAFQAIVDVMNKPMGFEALARITLTHSCQPVSPYMFFKHLRQQEKANQVLFKIIECHAKSFRHSPFFSPDVKLFINLSPNFFVMLHQVPGLITAIKKMLSEAEIPLENVVGELTECCCKQTKQLSKGLSVMKAENIWLAIDDFGEKCSNMPRYGSFRPNIVKISRKFYLSTLRDNPEKLISIIDGFKADGVHVVVEGVEEPEDFKLLTQMGVELFQGFHFHRPEVVTING
ncbi:hypothetical protein CS022_08215 [Veronia nyctiphanis]|uniref:EAL domain-containing protein n=1 Tax=Veronia nyctiphanis TaxID=1278244 RepID=A0A4V1LT24_9GAMM|nr:EAL domain-containing protein [Veronia nyctiphanis]RXJ73708.1 hypothetical protein CS022_08215 [Veronia nyctiphanis]